MFADALDKARPMKVRTAVAGGLLGGLLTSAMGMVARAVGIPVHLELLIGTMLLDPGPAAAALGFTIHMAASAAIALVYMVGFERWARQAGWAVGLGFSLVHTAVSGVALGLLPSLHPRVPDPVAEPGPFLAGLGSIGIAYFVAMHALYGTVVGAVYGSVSSGPRPVMQPEGSPKLGRTAASPEVDAGSEVEREPTASTRR